MNDAYLLHAKQNRERIITMRKLELEDEEEYEEISPAAGFLDYWIAAVDSYKDKKDTSEEDKQT